MVKRTGLFTNTVVQSDSILGTYKWGASISEKALAPTEKKPPRFDGRARRTTNAGGLGGQGGLLRGKIIQYRKEHVPMKEGTPKLQRSVNFLYNPEQISSNYSMDPSAFPAETQQTQFATVPVLGATGQTISWVLYFNRMYEVASDASQENMGVLADIQGLEYLLGSKDGQTQSMVECMVIFGSTPKLKPFAYIGYLSDLNVTYTHFSKRMIPTVARVEIGMVRRFVANDASAIAGEIANAVSGALADPTTPTNGLGIPDPGVANLPRPQTQTNRTVVPGGAGPQN